MSTQVSLAGASWSLGPRQGAQWEGYRGYSKVPRAEAGAWDRAGEGGAARAGQVWHRIRTRHSTQRTCARRPCARAHLRTDVHAQARPRTHVRTHAGGASTAQADPARPVRRSGRARRRAGRPVRQRCRWVSERACARCLMRLTPPQNMSNAVQDPTIDSCRHWGLAGSGPIWQAAARRRRRPIGR